MKLRVLILAIVFVTIADMLYAQVKTTEYSDTRHVEITLKEKSNVNWAIKGTEADTSESFDTNGIMTIFPWAADTSGTDSVALKAYFDVFGKRGWHVADSVSITSDSTETTWLLTDTPIPSGKTGRVRVVGQTGNKQDSYVIPDLFYDGCY